MSVLKAGQRLGAYHVEELVGRGGMAEVYRAQHMALERAVAIKVLNPILNADPTFLLRFLREAKAIAKLDHPNIITVHDFGEQGELAYLVMAFAERGTLREQARTFTTLEAAITGLAPVMEALQYAHDRGVVHRDIKPINVLIDAQGRPLLADFGLARLAVESLESMDPTGVMGTPYYMAPEQALGSMVDQRADIYALGIVTYEIIAGRLPYTGPTPYAIIQQHLTAPAPSLQAVMPGASRTLDAAIRRATAKDRGERFRSADEFLAELRQASDETPDLPIGTPHQHHATQPRSTDAPSSAGFFLVPAREPDVQPAGTPADPASAAMDLAGETLAFPADTFAPLVEEPLAQASFAPLAEGRRGRWSPPLSTWQWGGLALALLALLGLDAAIIGRVVTGHTFAAPLYSHRVAARLSLAGLDVALGVLNATLMRVAVLADHQFSIPTYRRLRQTHRANGYLTALVAIAVQALTWTALVEHELRSPWAGITLVCGSALLLLAVGKVGIVRYLRAQRRHLPLIGVTVLTLLALVFVTSLLATL